VFLPLLTLQGLEGKLFTPVALTIVFALRPRCCCR
jgi:cobalt-zinc-cadmium resistance protein CzcA